MSKMKKIKIIGSLKLILSVFLLLCLIHMPFAFYELVRFVAMVGFAVCAYEYYQMKENGLCVTFAALVLLFQPFFKITLGRGMWNVVDVVVAVSLLMLVYKESKKKDKKRS
jgi:predicted membrane protein